MTYSAGYRGRGFASRIVGIVLVVWLIIGAIAAGQRGYYSGKGDASCASVGTIIVTILAGPLNYVGVNPKIHCSVPQPSK
jgi:hypothetical protein